MHSSVSSQPSGRRSPSRPMPVAKPPAASKAVRRNEALPPSTLRTRTRPGGRPRYVQPTTQSNSSGNQAGRRPDAQTGSVRPPTAITRGSSYASAKCRSHSRSATASSSRKATTSPRAWAIPVLRPADRPRGPALASTRTEGASPNSRSSRSRRTGWWSTTSRVSSAGRDCARTEATAARMSVQRSSVWTQTTTEISGTAGPAGSPLRSCAAGPVTTPRRRSWPSTATCADGRAAPAGWSARRGSPAAPAGRRGPPAGC